jgi:hypothetical protein
MLPSSHPRLGFCMTHHSFIYPDRRSLLIKAAVTSASVIIPQEPSRGRACPNTRADGGPLLPNRVSTRHGQ